MQVFHLMYRTGLHRAVNKKVAIATHQILSIETEQKFGINRNPNLNLTPEQNKIVSVLPHQL